MKKQLLLCTVAVLMIAGVCAAQESAIQGKASLTYSTLYVWRGFNVYGSQSAIHPMVDLFSTDYSIGFSVEGHRANSDGYENFERWDYSLYYLGKMFAEQSYEINYRLAYVYYNYPELPSHTRNSIDLNEAHMVLSMPQVFQVKGLVPSYALVKLSPVNSGTIVGGGVPLEGTASGFAHIFMLDYAMPYVCPITSLDRNLNIHSELVFNDGVAPDGGGDRGPTDHDWSNFVLGASTDYEVADNLYFTPGFFHQITLDKSVNDNKSETWFNLGMSYKF